MFDESVSASASIWASINSWFTPTVFFVLLNVMIGTIALASSLTSQKQQQHQQQQQQQRDLQGEPQRPQLPRSPSVIQRLRSINLYGNRSQEPHSVNSTRFEHSQISDTHYLSQQSHLLQPLDTQTRYVFQHTHKTQAVESDTTFISEETHQEKPRQDPVIQSDFVGIRKPEPVLEKNQGLIEQQTLEADDENEELQSLEEVYDKLADHHVNRSKSDTKPASGKKPVRPPMKFRKSASSKVVIEQFEKVDNVEARRPATMRERRVKLTEEDEEVDAKADVFINKFKEQLKLQRIDSIVRKNDVFGRRVGK